MPPPYSCTIIATGKSRRRVRCVAPCLQLWLPLEAGTPPAFGSYSSPSKTHNKTSPQNPQSSLTVAAMMPSQKSPVLCGFCTFSPNGAWPQLCGFAQGEQIETHESNDAKHEAQGFHEPERRPPGTARGKWPRRAVPEAGAPILRLMVPMCVQFRSSRLPMNRRRFRVGNLPSA